MPVASGDEILRCAQDDNAFGRTILTVEVACTISRPFSSLRSPSKKPTEPPQRITEGGHDLETEARRAARGIDVQQLAVQGLHRFGWLRAERGQDLGVVR